MTGVKNSIFFCIRLVDFKSDFLGKKRGCEINGMIKRCQLYSVQGKVEETQLDVFFSFYDDRAFINASNYHFTCQSNI